MSSFSHFLYFYNMDNFLRLFTNDQVVLNCLVSSHFNATYKDDKNSFLVILGKDFTVTVDDASDGNKTKNFPNICKDMNTMYGWNIFGNIECANELVVRLYEIDSLSMLFLVMQISHQMHL